MAQILTIDGIDVTDNANVYVDWKQTELGNSVADGSSSLGQVVLKGNEKWLADNLGAAAHKVVSWTVDGVPLARGRVLSVQVDRGPLGADRDTQWNFAVGDYNDDLKGLVLLYNVSRPAETDVARVTWAIDFLCNGSPRADTVLDPSGISASNAVDMDAKVYDSGTSLLEILDECKDIAGKTYGVMVDGTFLYTVPSDTTYMATLSISDRVSEVDNNTVWAPDKIGGIPFSSESGEVLSDLLFRYGQGTASVIATSPHTSDVYWAGTASDTEITTEAMAQAMADSIVNSRDDDARTYSYAIQPLPVGKLGDIMAGQCISQKARVIPDSDDAATTPRIVELRWQYVETNHWMAIVRAGRPLRLQGFGGKKGDGPHAPTPPTAGSGDTLYEFLTWDSGEEQWDHPYGGDTGNVLSRSTYFSGGAASTTHGGNSGVIGAASPRLTVVAGDTYRISAYSEGYGQSWPCTAFGIINFSWGVKFYDSSATLLQTNIIGSHTTAQDSGYVGPDELLVTAPVGAAYLGLSFGLDPSLGCQQNATHIDQLSIYTVGAGGSVGDDPPPASDDQVGSVGDTTDNCYATCDHKHPAQAASVTTITDTNNYYTAANTEEAFNEIGAKLLSVMTTQGDMIYHGANGSNLRLPIGASNLHLVSDGTKPLWAPQTSVTNGGGVSGAVLAHGSMGATETFDVSAATWHHGTLNANLTVTLSGATSGTESSMLVELVQDGTGGWTLTLPSSVVEKTDLEAAYDTTASTTSFLTLFTRDGGTTWHGGFFNATGGGGSFNPTITSPAEDDQLQYIGGVWVNNNRRWEPVTTNPGTGPEIVYSGDEIVMTWKDY